MLVQYGSLRDGRYCIHTAADQQTAPHTSAATLSRVALQPLLHSTEHRYHNTSPPSIDTTHRDRPATIQPHPHTSPTFSIHPLNPSLSLVTHSPPTASFHPLFHHAPFVCSVVRSRGAAVSWYRHCSDHTGRKLVYARRLQRPPSLRRRHRSVSTRISSSSTSYWTAARSTTSSAPTRAQTA